MGKDINGNELGSGILQVKRTGRYVAQMRGPYGKRKYIYDDNLERLRERVKAFKENSAGLTYDPEDINAADDSI